MLPDNLPYKILIVDDDEDDFFITSQYIKNIKGNTFEVEWRYNYNNAMDDINAKRYDLYLVDYYLGAKTGLDLIKEAFANGCEEPIIILTGQSTPELDAEAMHAGAVDYLIKGEIDTEKLERCIRHVMEKSMAVKTLKSNERKFRHMFERSKDAVFLMDADTLHFTDVNAATTNLFGYTKESLFSISLLSLIVNNKDKQRITTALEQGEVEDFEMIMRTNDGKILFCIVSLSKETDNNGKPFLQGIIHDITALKKAEKNNLRLEKLGMAERLVRTLAHEVRNPLNNINLSLEQLADEIDNEDANLYLEIITRNSKRIETLITELLGASKPEIMLQKSSLQQIINDSLGVAADRMVLRKIKLQQQILDDVMYIQADKEKLQIALLNIYINAIEAMDDGGTLTVVVSDDGQFYKLLITDTGCGISEENLARLFEPYFTAKKNGLGLGLAATMNILQLHQATVEVTSTLQVGTTFTILIPKISTV